MKKFRTSTAAVVLSLSLIVPAMAGMSSAEGTGSGYTTPAPVTPPPPIVRPFSDTPCGGC